mgnify:FL=1
MTEPLDPDSTKVRRLGRRRVRTDKLPTQFDEPASTGEDNERAENDLRLREEKPPHY